MTKKELEELKQSRTFDPQRMRAEEVRAMGQEVKQKKRGCRCNGR